MVLSPPHLCSDSRPSFAVSRQKEGTGSWGAWILEVMLPFADLPDVPVLITHYILGLWSTPGALARIPPSPGTFPPVTPRYLEQEAPHGSGASCCSLLEELIPRDLLSCNLISLE